MQNTVYECKQNGEDFFSSLCVTSFRFGNYPANGLVTEQPQYSVVVCIFHILQNTEIQLISNDLRLMFTYSLLLASPCIFHLARHTFATTTTLWRTRQTLWRAVQMLTQKLCCQTIHDCPKVVPLHYESEWQ